MISPELISTQKQPPECWISLCWREEAKIKSVEEDDERKQIVAAMVAAFCSNFLFLKAMEVAQMLKEIISNETIQRRVRSLRLSNKLRETGIQPTDMEITKPAAAAAMVAFSLITHLFLCVQSTLWPITYPSPSCLPMLTSLIYQCTCLMPLHSVMSHVSSISWNHHSFLASSLRKRSGSKRFGVAHYFFLTESLVSIEQHQIDDPGAS